MVPLIRKGISFPSYDLVSASCALVDAFRRSLVRRPINFIENAAGRSASNAACVLIESHLVIVSDIDGCRKMA
jgi:hypothetical protein